DGTRAPRGWSRLLSTHPTAEQRIRALQTTTVGQRPDGEWIAMRTSPIAGAAERLTRAASRVPELEQ
ncbi:MAG: hypothetical protein JWP40_365, partial [Blastococcus sp.]|nr:hypothetical protein [Blastococcus sp.]